MIRDRHRHLRGFFSRRRQPPCIWAGDAWHPFQVLAGKAEVLNLMGRVPEAEAAAGRNLDWALAHGDLMAEARSRQALYKTLTSTGAYRKALEHTELAGELFSKIGDRRGRCSALLAQADLWCRMGRMDRALELLSGQQRLAGEIGDQTLRNRGLALSGYVKMWLGDFDGSVEMLTLQLEDSRSSGDRYREASSLQSLGVVRRLQGDYPQARRLLDQAIEMSRAIGCASLYATSLGSLAGLLALQGDYGQAISIFRRQIDLAARIGDRYALCCAYGDLGFAYHEMGDADRARDCYLRETGLCREIGDRLLGSYSLYKQAVLEKEFSGAGGALPLLSRAVDEVRPLGAERFLAIYLAELAEVRLDTGDIPGAREALSQAVSLPPQDETQLANLLTGARLRARDDQPSAVAELLELAASRPDDAARIHRELYRLTGDPDHRRRALELYRSAKPSFRNARAIRQLEET